ncbi:MAG: hypothetical protein MJ171_07505, partial [Clostridia bacterium]|nr:hypothetical protein [Clostridia bacterium]
IQDCNTILFNSAKELKEMAVNTYTNDSLIFNTLNLEGRICNGVKVTDFGITDFGYLYDDFEYDNIIYVDSLSEYAILNPLGIRGEIDFSCGVKTRAFVGYEGSPNPLDADAFNEYGKSDIVVIFPRYGIRYHDINCRYVVNYRYSDEFMLEVEYYEAIMRGYTPCLVCKGGFDEENS